MTRRPEPNATATPAKGERRNRTRKPGVRSKALRVLVVDDDKVDRLALRRALAQTGYDLQLGEADGVVAAINCLTTDTYDCVLLDYDLPDGDGLTFLRGLRRAGITTSVVMITGQQDDAVATELMEAGASDYIPKGIFTPGLLRRSLERLFGIAEAQKEENR